MDITKREAVTRGWKNTAWWEASYQ